MAAITGYADRKPMLRDRLELEDCSSRAFCSLTTSGGPGTALEKLPDWLLNLQERAPQVRLWVACSRCSTGVLASRCHDGAARELKYIPAVRLKLLLDNESSEVLTLSSRLD